MCQQEINNYKRENDNLRAMVNMQNLAASQAAQTAQLIADNTAQTQYIVNRVAPYPIPSYTVPNPFTPA
jgi:cell shape-determining protein MreC